MDTLLFREKKILLTYLLTLIESTAAARLIRVTDRYGLVGLGLGLGLGFGASRVEVLVSDIIRGTCWNVNKNVSSDR